MATTLVLESNFSTWIDVRGYNTIPGGGAVALGQAYVGRAGADRVDLPLNAFSIFPETGGDTVISGKLEIFFHGYISNQPSERIAVYDMNTNVGDLMEVHTVGSEAGLAPGIFQDAQTGGILGEMVYTDVFPGSWGQLIQMDLTPAAIAWLNVPETDSPFAIGYTVRDVAPREDISLLFSSSPGLAPRLVLEVIPEPGGFLMLGLGAALFCMARRRLRGIRRSEF